MTDSPAEAVGRRIGAGLVDLLVIFVLMFVVGLLFGQGYASNGHAGVALHGPSVVVWAIVCLGYYFVLELLIGQTLGKRLLGIHVVSRNGGKPSAAAIGIRTLLRIIDFLPFFTYSVSSASCFQAAGLNA